MQTILQNVPSHSFDIVGVSDALMHRFFVFCLRWSRVKKVLQLHLTHPSTSSKSPLLTQSDIMQRHVKPSLRLCPMPARELSSERRSFQALVMALVELSKQMSLLCHGRDQATLS